jgi:hypothetical protein
LKKNAEEKIVIFYVENALLDLPNTKTIKVEINQEIKEKKLKPYNV